MSAPNSGMQYTAHLSRQWLAGVSTAAENAATVDRAGKWGVDGWIGVIHDLVDLQIRTVASVIRTGIAGPWWLETPDDVIPAEPVEVDPRPYPRKIVPVEFVRWGMPDEKIPLASISVEDTLAANAKSFRVTLRDDRYLGSNYVAKFILENLANGSTDCTVKVTVGL